MRRPDEGLILQPVRVFARPRPKADTDLNSMASVAQTKLHCPKF
jgi:hypothetical protein